jgi:hypothetical protein
MDQSRRVRKGLCAGAKAGDNAVRLVTRGIPEDEGGLVAGATARPSRRGDIECTVNAILTFLPKDTDGRCCIDEQNHAIAVDYFAMFADDIAGRPYSKAEHNRSLRTATGR